uniref:Uncharacterized protein n=1 Tax=Aureoumbra lagunensis TaxID=44058 RepID=A0A6S8ANN2_9STRA|mmetsp:Transcript_13325/g.17801  ORF Transcript_13325/g.17801 Transcript_13325/m.17801 type:complete len:337 (+) Transcript_13325:130-1140(+)|eukprot:CAMPEP_0197294196 /NCGR_PEP_ID=MMETSP0890-20130614/31482_1 /TAXON_ID=44058 ORGANISM="Aureoumbra lagunensis, Strain CCMP1510" /NCGR_SAMPLE_ID=MMETSP0890 /ASSEMBLY_ACC=CAM_ASM_000533 /LENGTH=336 /DNA_ID=CAMNT_0042769455 /DNA_START=129 /DNA_END=1139 /DNA_ORIENTATION=-
MLEEELRARVHLQRERNAACEKMLKEAKVGSEIDEKEIRLLRRRFAEATRRKMLAIETLAVKKQAKDHADRRRAFLQVAQTARQARMALVERRKEAMESLKTLHEQFERFIVNEEQKFQAFLTADHSSFLQDINAIEKSAILARDAALVTLVATDPAAERLEEILKEDCTNNQELLSSLRDVAKSARLARREQQKCREQRAFKLKCDLISESLTHAVNTAMHERDTAIGEYRELAKPIKQRADALPQGPAREDALLVAQTSPGVVHVPRLGLPMTQALQADQHRLAKYRYQINAKLKEAQSRQDQDILNFEFLFAQQLSSIQQHHQNLPMQEQQAI